MDHSMRSTPYRCRRWSISVQRKLKCKCGFSRNFGNSLSFSSCLDGSSAMLQFQNIPNMLYFRSICSIYVLVSKDVMSLNYRNKRCNFCADFHHFRLHSACQNSTIIFHLLVHLAFKFDVCRCDCQYGPKEHLTLFGWSDSPSGPWAEYWLVPYSYILEDQQLASWNSM